MMEEEISKEWRMIGGKSRSRPGLTDAGRSWVSGLDLEAAHRLDCPRARAAACICTER